MSDPQPKTVYCMDLGTGTIDILLRDAAKLPENWTRIVAPSPALTHMKAVERAPGPVFVDGWVVGGGPFKKALVKHAARHRTVLHPNVSAIVKNNLQVVLDAGIEVGEEVPEGATKIWADELRIADHLDILAKLGEDPPDGFAVAVQDHGGSDDGLPDRVHRFSEFQEILDKRPHLQDFAFTAATVPAPFRRMQTACRYLEEHGGGRPYLVMDTVFAGLLGCLASRPQETAGVHLAVNIGNSHTTAALVDDEEVVALFEHHTRIFKRDGDLLATRLGEFVAGALTEQGVRDDGGCGVWYREAGAQRTPVAARCSGPRREILAGRTLPDGTVAEEAFAGVDPMMVGPLGLAAAWDRLHGGDA